MKGTSDMVIFYYVRVQRHTIIMANIQDQFTFEFIYKKEPQSGSRHL